MTDRIEGSALDLHEVEIIYSVPLKGKSEPTLVRYKVPGGWCYESITYSINDGGNTVTMSKSMCFVPTPLSYVRHNQSVIDSEYGDIE